MSISNDEMKRVFKMVDVDESGNISRTVRLKSKEPRRLPNPVFDHYSYKLLIALNKLNVYLLVSRLYSCHYDSHCKLNIFLQEARMASKLLSKEFGIEDVSFDDTDSDVCTLFPIHLIFICPA